MASLPKPDDLNRRLIMSEEDRRTYPTARQWNGGYRWFRSANVIDLQNYRSQAEQKRIKVRLLFQDERWC
jgi:hypothetical protein